MNFLICRHSFYTRYAVMLKFLHILLLGSFIEFVGAQKWIFKEMYLSILKINQHTSGNDIGYAWTQLSKFGAFFYCLKYATNSFENWKWIATTSKELIFDNLKNGSVTQQTLTCVIVMCTRSVVYWLCGIFAKAKSWWII